MSEFAQGRLEFLTEGFLDCVFLWRNAAVFEQFGEFRLLPVADSGIERNGLTGNGQIVPNLGGFDF